MDVSDLIFDSQVSLSLKAAVLELLDSEGFLRSTLQVLVPTDSNNDVNGSQHVSEGGTDFTYRHATIDDLENAHSLGFYEYFSGYYGNFTGHYYNGDGNHFEALVVNPPAYAATVYL